jgi:hypothetical protein
MDKKFLKTIMLCIALILFFLFIQATLTSSHDPFLGNTYGRRYNGRLAQ